MDLQLNRRQWLKAGVMAASGLVLGTDLPVCSRDSFFPFPADKQEESVILNRNENPYGLSEAAREAIIRAMDKSNRYPHVHYQDLRKMIARQEDISPEHIILGAGSTEVMSMAIHSYGTRGEVLAADPTYFDFVYYAEKAKCRLQKVPLNEEYAHDLDAMERYVGSKTSLIYVCNPNNPTATIVAQGKLRSFCEHASRQALVVVDEAYHGYVEDKAYASMVELVKRGEKILVTRTFSKIYGLAGLRIGYGLAHPDVIADLKQAQMNFAPIAYPSLRAAMSSYQDSKFCRFSREKNELVKSYLYTQLERLGYFCIPSQTNFVLFKVKSDARDMAKDLESRLILVRPFAFMGDNWIRVSLGTLEEIKTFTAALANIS